MQPLPHTLRLGSRRGDLEDIVFRQVEKRALQQGRQRKIILRQHHEPAERQKILHGDVIGQAEAVGTGNGNVLTPLQLAGQRVDEGSAFSDKHENIAGFDGALHALFDDGFVSDHIGNARGDTPGDDGGRRAFPQRVEGGGPVLFIFGGFRCHHIPHFHGAGMAGAVGTVFDGLIVGAEAARVFRV
ncbi:hypothetical protein SRABI05_04814 [Agrobacterium fabrum]|nr:hypothetical protein SRABI05_04814 [Agrobacterium fabrum]